MTAKKKAVAKKPIQVPATNRPDTTDPFNNPLLGALRSRDAQEEEYIDGGENTCTYNGDFKAVGATQEGAQIMLDAVVACFEAEGVKPVSAKLVEHIPFLDVVAENLRILGKREFSTEIVFHPRQQDEVVEAIAKITRYSRYLQGQQEAAGGIAI